MDASHSFISFAFTSTLGLEVAQLASPLRVESPGSGEVVGRQLIFSFALINMSSFDAILGMNWLSSCRAIIDCYRQRVTVCTSSGDCFYFLGDRVDRVLLPVYDSRSRSELNCLLATLLDSKCDEI
ncbi:hypothetical protein ACSBR1_012214 [Camellia fascicularis]